MRIRWTPDAVADLEQIHEYLQSHFPQFAKTTMVSIYEMIRSLRSSPHLGRPGRREGTRELVCAPLPYIAVYRLREQFIEILNIYHGARNRPN